MNHKIKLPEYVITAARGSRIYRCQLSACNAEDALSPVALVVSKLDDPKTLGLKNMTQEILEATTPSGREKRVSPQDVVPFISGIKINAYGSKIELQ